jgi:transposase
MKTNSKFIGIDVSKDTLDVCVLSEDCESTAIKNTERSICGFFKKLLRDSKECQYHICIENTGKYSWELMRILPQMECLFYVVNPLHLKKSLGLVRGKNDAVDAIRIARFIKKNNDELCPYIPRREEVESLQILLAERKFRVGQRKQLKTKNKEMSVLGGSKLAKSIISKNDRLIRELNGQIKEIEAQMNRIIASDDRLRDLATRLKSVPGVGDVLCGNLLVRTNEFRTITDPRKLACYAGVAPFSNTSGISVFGRNRVSNLADKGLKKLLHLGALSAIRLDNDLAAYYHRKISEGKNKMSVLNAVRNKIIHIVFSLIKNQTFFENRLVLS